MLNNRNISVSILFSLFIVCFCLISHANSTSDETFTYIIHMDKSCMPMAYTDHHHWYSSIVESAKSIHLDFFPSHLYSYDNAIHGFSAVLTRTHLDSMKNFPGFVSAYRDRLVTLDTTHTTDFLSLNYSAGLWPASKLGEDVIIGVIDSGFWPESESFKDDGMNATIPAKWKGKCEGGEDNYGNSSSMCNKKVIGVRYFNKGVIAAHPNITMTMNSARDTAGHGTHTSSTVAGNFVDGVSFFGYAKGTARGVAPRARLAIYKVTWDEGRYASDVLAAMDQAIADGVDVISISMGNDNVKLYEDPIAISSFAAMEKGVVVSTSAGNTGPYPKTLHNGIPWVLTVGAGTIDRSFSGTLTLGNGHSFTGWTMFPARARVDDIPLLYNKTLSLCNSSDLLSKVAYSIIICQPTGSLEEQINTVAASQLFGAIFISNHSRIFELGGISCPSLVISPEDAKVVIKYALTNEVPFASMLFQHTTTGAKNSPAVAYYSSRGPSTTSPGILKPDLIAPGSLVLAAWPPNLSTASIGSNVFLYSDYNMISGTSMACPHASGVAVLLKGAHPEWSPAAIRSAMMTTANTLDNNRKPIRDNANLQIASPLAMGAGHIEPNKALDPGLIYDATPQDYVNFLCSMNMTQNQLLSITRSSSYSCSKPNSDLNYPSFMVLHNNKTTSTMFHKFQRTVTNVGSDHATYKIKVKPPPGSMISVSPETLIFNKKNEKQSYIMNVKYKKRREVAFGEIVWIEQNGKHRVRSPIVISPEDFA
uniref:Subtilisin n=1 Tax=Datisca glomerata TaxID=34297 RepID=A0A3Q8TKJ1_DATGL|nr:subtilisin [Datisca glomerata]